MLNKLLFGLTVIFIGSSIWTPEEASAILITKYVAKSIVCDVTEAGGGNPQTDHFVNCAVKVKEITGFCKNPASGAAVTPNGKPFTVNAFTSASSTGTWTKTANGKDEQVLLITNQKIQEALDVSNSQNGNPFIFLKTTQVVCKPGWVSFGYFITKTDAALSDAKVPSLQDSNHNVIASGHTSYQYETPQQCPSAVVSSTSGVPSPLPLTTHSKCVAIPYWPYTWNADGEDGTSTGTWNNSSYVYVKVSDFVADPFRYCSRFPTPVATTMADNGVLKPADSGLRIYSYNASTDTGDPTTGEYIPLSVSDSTYKLNDCFLWRDVNKDPAFKLELLGTYDPDVAHIMPPQTGNPQQKVKGQLVSVSDDKLGGLVLTSVSSTAGADNFYTGECHQHGKETNGGGNYSWNQQGPQKDAIDPTTGAPIPGTGDSMCLGGSQLMDGIYDDGIFP